MLSFVLGDYTQKSWTVTSNSENTKITASPLYTIYFLPPCSSSRPTQIVYTVIQEIFIQDFFVFVIFMVFNFSFLYWNLM